MNDEIIQHYINAGKAVAEAKKLARVITKPGSLFIDIAKLCEEVILNQGCDLSFPINMSLNDQAAHYSPPIDDPTIIPERGLLKIDLGAHDNGYIADSAFTINLDEDPKLQNFIEAADEGLEAAIEIFKPGTKLYELGAVIDKKIQERGLNPIKNLGGHELKQYNLHAGPFIPNFKDIKHKNVLKPGDAYAIEPFSTNGRGYVVNGNDYYIYRLIKTSKKNMSYPDQGFLTKILNNFKKLPFSDRWFLDRELLPKDKIKRFLTSFIGRKIIDKYNILIEQSRGFVAQQEHTVVIDMDGKTIVTTRE